MAWVVTAFNLAIALAAVPAARLATRRPAGQVCAGGLVLFACASAACALAPSLAFLVGARAVQGIGGAAAVCAALELLPELAGGERRAVRVWAAAGVAGAALGPAIGGLLTQLISWQSIFVAQVPLALIPVDRRRRPRRAARRGGARACRTSPPTSRSACSRPGSPRCCSCSCCCSSRAGAWRRSRPPLPSRRCRPRRSPSGRSSGALPARARARRPARCSGAGGVAALGLLPGAGWAWTLAPQLLVGAGLALSLGALTEAALAGRSPAAIHGGWTIASRHAGVVLGLVLLTPVFVGDLDKQRERATQKGAELVLDARVDALTQGRSGAADRERHPARAGPPARHPPLVRRGRTRASASGRSCGKLEGQLNDQLDRAATSSFERSFLFAAALAGLALIPIALTRGRDAVRPRCQSLATLACSAALAASVPRPISRWAAAPTSPRPCAIRAPSAAWRDPGGLQAVAEQIALSALDGAACHFGVSRETLTLALATLELARALRARAPHRQRRARERRAPRPRALGRRRRESRRDQRLARDGVLRFGAEHVPVEQMADLVDALLAGRQGGRVLDF